MAGLMAWLMVLQALVTLWLAWACWRYARAAAEANASLWQALAALRMHHNELEGATSAALGVIDDRFDELDAEVIAVAPPNRCNCPDCRKRRQLAVN